MMEIKSFEDIVGFFSVLITTSQRQHGLLLCLDEAMIIAHN